jgi:hypothetical protein
VRPDRYWGQIYDWFVIVIICILFASWLVSALGEILVDASKIDALDLNFLWRRRKFLSWTIVNASQSFPGDWELDLDYLTSGIVGRGSPKRENWSDRRHAPFEAQIIYHYSYSPLSKQRKENFLYSFDVNGNCWGSPAFWAVLNPPPRFPTLFPPYYAKKLWLNH